MTAAFEVFQLFLKRSPQLIGRAYIHRTVSHTLRWLKKRRDLVGPETPAHRSTYLNWNYHAELYAFGKRLQEDFREESLRTAFTHKSYIQMEEQKRKELELSDVPHNLVDNEQFVEKGTTVMDDYVKHYLRFAYPYLPEEGILAIHEFLTSDEILSHVSSNIGTSDLILCKDFPPTKQTLAKTLKAILGILQQDNGNDRTENFIQDFILTQLIGRDVSEMWQIVNPMGTLVEILKREGRALPESRLLWQSGQRTIQAVYNVGLYSNYKLIGMGPGETVIIAEEMAARDALKRLFKTTDQKSPLAFGNRGHGLKLSRFMTNPSINEWTTKLATERYATSSGY